jgi:hypothetical protein
LSCRPFDAPTCWLSPPARNPVSPLTPLRLIKASVGHVHLSLISRSVSVLHFHSFFSFDHSSLTCPSTLHFHPQSAPRLQRQPTSYRVAMLARTPCSLVIAANSGRDRRVILHGDPRGLVRPVHQIICRYTS